MPLEVILVSRRRIQNLYGFWSHFVPQNDKYKTYFPQLTPFLYNKIMITAMSRHVRERIVFVLISGFVSFLIAFFIDQYYIAGKGWWFLLELVE